MGIKNYLGRKADNICAATSGVAGAALGGQFPQFLAQYIQRLGGHVDEAQLMSIKYPEIAERVADLESGLVAIQDAGLVGKIGAFIQNVDWDIASRAYENFTPGITFDSEGVAYAALGAAAGLGAYELAKMAATGIGKGIKKIYHRKEKKE